MSSRLNFLPMPAPDSVLEGCSLVVGKEVADILIVFELRFDFLGMFNGMIGFHGLPICLSCVIMQPVLEFCLEMKALPEMRHEECA